MQGGNHLRVGGVGVAGGDDHARGLELPDDLRLGHLRRERHQGAPDAEGGQQSHGAGVELAQLGGIVDALALDVEEGALDVDAEHARHACLDSAAGSGDRACDDIEIRADQRRHEAGGAEAAVSAPDLPDGLDCSASR